MKKLLSVVVGLMVAGSLVAAQAAKTPSVKVKQQVTFSQDVKVGSSVLKSGIFEVSSSGAQLTFRRMIPDVAYPGVMVFDMKEKPVVVACTVTTLPAKSHGTSLDVDGDNGAGVLKSLTLDGTNVKFTITQ